MTRRTAGMDATLVASVFVTLVLGSAPSLDWLDSGELLTAAWVLGVAHPPGEPGWLAPVRLAQLLPVGDIALRANLFSALCVAACAWPLLALSRALEDGGPRPRALPELAVVAIGLMGFGARMQGARAEVYALTALLLICALAAVVVWGGRRASAALGALVGYAATVHPLLVAAAVPALLVARWVRSPVRAIDPVLTLAFGLGGFAANGWLPLRAAASPQDAWGVPDSIGATLDVLLGRTFAQNFGGDGAALWDNLAVVFGRLAFAGVPAALLVGCAALWWLRSSPIGARPRTAMTWAVPLWLLCNAATVVPQNKVFGTNPDLLGYLAVGALAAAPLAGLAIAAGSGVARTAGPPQRAAVALLTLIALAALLQIGSGLAADRSGNQLARRYAVAQSIALPPGAVLMVSGNDTAFAWQYLQRVERRRPDLVVVPRVLLGHEHVRVALSASLSDAGLPWSRELQAAPVPLLLAGSRPAFIERRDPEAEAALTRHGLVWAVHARSETPILAAERDAVVRALAGPSPAADAQAHLVRGLFLALAPETP